jgi:hypothetical protein
MKGVTVEKIADKDVAAAVARLNSLVDRLYANQMETVKQSSVKPDDPPSGKSQIKFRRAPQ